MGSPEKGRVRTHPPSRQGLRKISVTEVAESEYLLKKKPEFSLERMPKAATFCTFPNQHHSPYFLHTWFQHNSKNQPWNVAKYFNKNFLNSSFCTPKIQKRNCAGVFGCTHTHTQTPGVGAPPKRVGQSLTPGVLLKKDGWFGWLRTMTSLRGRH